MMLPKRRNKTFELNTRNVNDWHQAGPGVTQFLNAMSLFFPAGERYFIRSVRAVQHKTSTYMKEPISAFVGQEAFHGREHEKLNALLNTPLFDKVLERTLERLSERLPVSFNLAATCALEHLTAILAQGLLEDIKYFADSDPEFRDMWIWHALEETEHKAVAFDAFEEVVHGPITAYFVRSVALVLGTAIFLVWLSERYVTLLYRNKQLNVKHITDMLAFVFDKPGIFRKAIPRWFDWFRPDFHPWDHDNTEELSKYKELLETP